MEILIRKNTTAPSSLKILINQESVVPLDYKYLKDTLEIPFTLEMKEGQLIGRITEENFKKIQDSKNVKLIGETGTDIVSFSYMRECLLRQNHLEKTFYTLMANDDLAIAVFRLNILQYQEIFPIYQLILNVDKELSAYTNDTGYITNAVENLINYYSKTDVDNLINAIHTLDIQIVTELPTENISHTTIYLKGTETSGTNDYEEWIYTVNNSWELIGSTAVDLTGYLKTKDADKGYLQKKTGSEMAALADINTADINNNGMIVLCTEESVGTNYHYQQGHIYILTIYAEQGAIESIGWRDITSTYYKLPTASAETLGGVKVGKTEGSGIKIDENGEISVDPAVYLSIKDIRPILERKIEYIGDGVNTSFTFTAEPYCIIDFYVCDKKTGEEVYPNIKKDNYDKTMIITFTKPPKASEYVLHYSIGICLDNSGSR